MISTNDLFFIITNTLTHTHTHTHTHHTHTHTLSLSHTHTRTHTYAHTHTHKHTHTYTTVQRLKNVTEGALIKFKVILQQQTTKEYSSDPIQTKLEKKDADKHCSRLFFATSTHRTANHIQSAKTWTKCNAKTMHNTGLWHFCDGTTKLSLWTERKKIILKSLFDWSH